MKYTDKQIEYFKTRAGGNKFLLKETIQDFLKNNNIQYDSNLKKSKLLDIIYSNDILFENFIDKYSSSLEVPYYTVATSYNLTYFQVSEMDQLGIIKQLPYTGNKGETLYPFSILGYEDNYFLIEYEKKFKTGFHRTRIEFTSDDEKYIQDFLNKLSVVFDLENISKLYPHRTEEGYYLYLSIRVKTDSLNNNDILTAQNSKLKADLAIKEERIYKLKRELIETKNQLYKAQTSSAEYKRLYEEELNKQAQVGRPSKLSAQDIETIKMYRLQGKTYRELAAIFNCSIGLISKYLKDFN